MRFFFLSLLLVAVCGTFMGCRSPKSSARIYEGDGPNIKFNESHAGGPVGSY